MFVDEVYKRLDGNQQGWKLIDETYIQITAWGSLDREVPRRNLRRWSLLSWEKVYNLDSDDFVFCQRCMLLADMMQARTIVDISVEIQGFQLQFVKRFAALLSGKLKVSKRGPFR